MAISFKSCKVEVSPNGTTWTDISAHAVAVEVSGGDRGVGNVFFFGADVPVLIAGAREPIEITVRAAYTEATGEAFELARAAYEDGSPFYVRFSPKGGASGTFLFTSDAGLVKSLKYPQGEAGSGDPVLVEFVVTTPKLTKSVVV